MDVLVAGGGRPYLDGDTLDHSAPLVFTIPNVLDRAECAAMVERIEGLGPAAAPITTSHGFEMRPDIRNNTRVMFDETDLAARMFSRIRDAIPPVVCGMHVCGLNERFRCYRYEPGQRFAPHYDGAFARSELERSHLTFIIYLNDGFGGGTTMFHDVGIDVVPKPGMALLFQHFLLHEGCTVTSGVKYAMRSDVMYRAA